MTKRYANWKQDGFPRWLQARMMERNWNAHRLSKEMGVGPSIISRWMTGAVQPHDESLRAIACAMQLCEEDVFRAAGFLSSLDDTPEDPRRLALIQKVGAITLTAERYFILSTLLNAILESSDQTIA